MVKKLPVPICGLALGLAALGNLLGSYSLVIRYCLGALSGIILLALTLRIAVDCTAVKKELDNPVVLSVFSTYFMTWVLLAAYVRPWLGWVATAIWLPGLVLHGCLMVFFACRYWPEKDIKTVFPSWFVLFVGFVVGSVTSPVMGLQGLGRILFYLGFFFYLALLPLVLYRVVVIKGMPEPTRPTYAIFCAPVSLCLAGYLSAFDTKHPSLVYFMLALTLISYVGVLGAMVRLVRLPFYPSYSAFTFPLVISASAQKMAGSFLQGRGVPVPAFLISVPVVLAVVVVAYVFIRYALFLCTPRAKD